MSTGPRRLGKYELRERLGRGGMAEVWKAWDTQLQRYVAIKFLHTNLQTEPEATTRFVREAQAIASLRHPNIVQIHDFQIPTEADDSAYMVMNYIQGQTLAEYIRDTSRQGKFPPAREIIQLFVPISSAIDYAHQRGIIHRDIKPTNIMLDQRSPSQLHLGKPILMDFGIVKLLRASTSTISGTFLGTPHYMSPEQAKGLPGDKRSDIYSLGVILYEICTGIRPFQGDNPAVIMMQHVTAIPTPPGLINPNIPPALAEVILHSLAKDPQARYPSATSMARAMAEALDLPPPPINPNAPSYTIDPMNGPAYSTPSHPNMSSMQSLTPSLPAIPGESSSPFVAAPPTPQFPIPMGNLQHTPTTSSNAFPSTTSFTNADQRPAAMTPVQPPPSLTPPPQPRPRKRGMTIALIVAAIIVLVGASTGGLYLLTHTGGTPPASNGVVGQAFFVSSGQVYQKNSQGIDDELRIELNNLANPAPGKSYYAWLLGDQKQSFVPSLLLGRLNIDNGKVIFPYLHDQQHTNLLGLYSQFLITEEDTNNAPRSPTADKSAWIYFAQLPQIPDGSLTNQSALDYMRELLVRDPNGAAGMDVQFLRNTYQVFARANSARGSWNLKDAHAIRNQVISILDYLDSTAHIQQDVPAGTPLLVDAQTVKTPLIDFSQSETPASYFSLMRNELNSLLGAPGITPEMSTLATQARNALPDVQNWLKMVHTDAVLLMKMSDAQLLEQATFSMLNSMVNQASFAYAANNPSTNQLQGGALWIHKQIQNLATFEVKKYVA